MHAPYDRSRQSRYRSEPKKGFGFLALPAIVAFVLITLTIAYPKSSVWIAQAVEAELGFAPNIPLQTAQPGMTIPMRTVDAY